MIRYKRPDREKALSLIKSAKSDFGYTLSLELNEKSANTIVRNIYESFRMIGEALLVAKGVQSQDHVLPINELISLNVKLSRPLIFLEQLRKIRRNINYYGYHASVNEAENVLDFSKEAFDVLVEKALEVIG